MNDTIKGLRERTSVRIFEPRPIPQTMKEEILEAALQAPTAGNQILYTIIDVQQQTLKDALAQSCDNQPFIAAAPLVLVFLADCRRWYDAYTYAGALPRKPGAGDALLACADALIAAQNTVVAAHSMGLGSCYIGDILENKEQVAELLGLDEYTLPAAMVVYGWPTPRQQQRQKPRRFHKEYIVQANRYRRLSPEEMREMFARQRGSHTPQTSFEQYITAFCKRKYESGFALEMNRSAAEYLRAFEPFASENG